MHPTSQWAAMKVLPLLFILITLLPCIAAEPEGPPPFTKDDARRILVAQEWRDIRVIAVVQGVSAAKVASPSLSHALALAQRDGRWTDLKFDVFYDRDLGWFTYESSPQGFRVWTREGFREITQRLGW